MTAHIEVGDVVLIYPDAIPMEPHDGAIGRVLKIRPARRPDDRKTILVEIADAGRANVLEAGERTFVSVDELSTPDEYEEAMQRNAAGMERAKVLEPRVQALGEALDAFDGVSMTYILYAAPNPSIEVELRIDDPERTAEGVARALLAWVEEGRS